MGFASCPSNALARAMAEPLRAQNDHSRSAIFSRPGEPYHADRCAPLRAAVRRGEVKLAALARSGYPGRRLPAAMLPQVSTVGFWDATGPQTWGLGWHRNEGLELTYLARGRTEFLVDRQSFLLQSGSLTITRPWQEHRVGNPNIGANRLCWLILDVGVRRPNQAWKWPDWLILSPTDLRRLTGLLSHNEQPVWQANEEVGACFARLAGLVQAREPLAVQTRLQLHINELFVVLLELLEKKKVKLDARLTTTRRTVELFLATLPEHLEEPWTLPAMARQCGLGSSAFSDYCSRITNQTPAKYLAHCRLEAARKLLLSRPDLSITDLAFACGFQSSQYLATAFRQQTGQSPRAFRAAHAGRQGGVP